MHELEKQIAAWRQGMADAAGQREELLDELETHLREEIERLRRSGAAEDTLFPRALAKLGAPSALANEYAKLTQTTPWLPVRITQILALVLLALAVLLGAFLIRRSGTGPVDVLLLVHVLCVTMGYGLMFLLGGLCLCYLAARWLRDPGSTAQFSLRRTLFQFAHLAAVFTAVGIVLGMFWAKEHMGRYWDWDLKEVGGFLVISWAGLLCAVQWLRTHYSIPLLAGILGNAVTAWAWFGTRGTPELVSAWLSVFIVSQILFVVAGAIFLLRHERVGPGLGEGR